jgi:NADPH:quinone reductase-like Zn-dependent oxidoreductase
VFGSAQGAYGERVVARPEDVLPLPDVLSFDQGAGAWTRSTVLVDAYSRTHTGLFVTYPTSYEALVGRAKLQAGACAQTEQVLESLCSH